MSLYVAYYQQDFDLGSTLTDEMLAAYNNSGEPV